VPYRIVRRRVFDSAGADAAMIRILYMSDLHLEMERWRLGVPGWAAFMAGHRAVARHPARGPLLNDVGKVDLVVLAGDIHNGLRGLVYAEQVADFLAAPVVMVAGNHEYYHHDFAILLPALRHAAERLRPRVNFLENASACFTFGQESLTVLGCSLWTDYALNGDARTSMLQAQEMMNDYSLIRNGRRAFSPWNARPMHETSLAWLHETLGEGGRSKNLVVTHHAPSGLVLGQRQGRIAPAYGSEIIGQFAEKPPAAWIHGHTHFRHDSVVAGIRLVSAPRGYVGFDGDKALNFVPGILEI
jgi:predicted phosphodiesterase